MSRVFNILISSVGGQGGLTLSRIMAVAAVRQGLSARTGETLGMAQRFGSVLSFARVGEDAQSPIFGPGEADYIISLELFETVRATRYLRDTGVVFAADEYKPPVSASLSPSPAWARESVLRSLKEVVGEKLLVVPARDLAVRAGSARAINVVMLGVFNAHARLFADDVVYEAIKSVLPGRAGEVSVKAYELGKAFYAERAKSA